MLMDVTRRTLWNGDDPAAEAAVSIGGSSAEPGLALCILSGIPIGDCHQRRWNRRSEQPGTPLRSRSWTMPQSAGSCAWQASHSSSTIPGPVDFLQPTLGRHWQRLARSQECLPKTEGCMVMSAAHCRMPWHGAPKGVTDSMDKRAAIAGGFQDHVCSKSGCLDLP